MKSNFWKLILNPFTRIAGWQAFFVGLVIAVLTAVIGTLSGVTFDGAMDAHIGSGYGSAITFSASFKYLAISIISVVGMMSLGALVLTRDFRFIDILGTMTLARAPMLLFALATFLAPPTDPATLAATPLSAVTLALIIMGVVAILAIIWFIALMYNGMRVSCNVRGTKLIIVFVVSLVLAEAVSKLAIHYLT